ncbi:spermidine/putrescine ABC transporter permease PotB [Actinobacillus pleuropneumoniae]|uniref:Spermidine/putrescine ABC transporter membrane protein n=1 Tax=Actinobacillus pleuropneumoniae TaxID=715 RepID=A0A3S4ZU28_ACTPL|nr:spermidine/putrescine ABC transporter permease PotB [Actinobacillus pleuropneumoniae]EFM88395.1 Spermidine/putrescine transport system permease protein potB [Actinobacillus pleuropneumoniae serovar 2 str. S1536]EFM97035.1 Spermidine/putrescine transport system permease protein potB [Actinobacillus pleuropneumoniae serovar 10 str. D13039]MBL4536573.1 spermidine/putrescine ABC transporter permease PotB [Actinobacillus pleuropneumoniae]MCI1069391.1 spermidine/putrescine ABC transporter permease
MKIANNKFQAGTVSVIFGWLLLFVLVPNVLVLLISFLTENRQSAYFVDFIFSLDAYTQLFNDTYATVLWNSFKMSAIATFFCLIIGYPFAFIIAKMPAKIRPILLFLVVLPFWTNSLIRIYGIKIFLGVKGVLNEALLAIGLIDEPLRLLNSELAIIIGLVYILLPFMILPLYSSIEKIDGRLLEAAKDLGASAFQRFVRVTIPLTMPGIVAGCLLVLLPAMGMFYVADLLGGGKTPLIGNIIKSLFLNTNQFALGSAVSIALTVLMALMLYVYYRANKLLNKKVELE